MSVALAVGVVGLGSLAFRLVPLLGAHRVPSSVSRIAGWAGLSLLAALITRSIAHHSDTGVPGAPLVAAVSLAVALVVAHRGLSALVSVASGALTYLVLSSVVTAL